MGLCDAMVQATLRRANGRRVHGVRVRVGGHLVDREVIAQGFRLAASGTVAEDAEVDLVLDPMTLECASCGRRAPVNDHLAMVACPGCGGLDITLSGMEGAVLESITVDAPPVVGRGAARAGAPPTTDGSAP